ncbi:hypothetical protein ACWGPD_25135 [Streptomyces hirsutus]|uniref:hypothetical protein n=1 Tax=Streptomyces hirsutus TaxID=35620 RepID=UPI003627029A
MITTQRYHRLRNRAERFTVPLASRHTWDRKNGHPVKETKPDYRRQTVATLQDLADYGELFGAGGYVQGFRPWGRRCHVVEGMSA